MLRTLNRKRSSCTLVITTSADDADGYFYIKDGEIITATQGHKQGPCAAAAMLAWDEPSITIYSLPTHTVSNLPVEIASQILHGEPLLVDQPLPTEESVPEPAPLLKERVLSSSLDLVDNDEVSPSEHTSLPFVQPPTEHKETSMANLNEILKEIMEIDGATNVAIVDWTSGMSLGSITNGINVDLAAAGNSNVVRAKLKIMKDLGLKDSLEDILITLETQYHLIRILESNPNLFIYLILNKTQGNLGMARYRLTQIEKGLVI